MDLGVFDVVKPCKTVKEKEKDQTCLATLHPAHIQGCQMSGQQLLTSSPNNGRIEGSMSCEIDPPQELGKDRSLVVLQAFKLGTNISSQKSAKMRLRLLILKK